MKKKQEETRKKVHHYDMARRVFHDNLKILSDFWSLIILHELRHEPKRYGKIVNDDYSISPVTLTNRLKKLQNRGLVYRLCHTHDKQSVEYGLTDRGKCFLPILDGIVEYLHQHFCPGDKYGEDSVGDFCPYPSGQYPSSSK